MNILKSLSLAALIAAGLNGAVAQASVIGSLGQNVNGTAFTLSNSNVSGGLLLSNTVSTAIKPSDTVGLFLAGEPVNAGGSATVTFTGGVSDVSFLWGTPDLYNLLVVTEANGTTTNFSVPSFGISNFQPLGINNNTYVNFADTGSSITSLTFVSTSPGFEAANFRVTSAVPEPTSIALLGLGLFGFVAARRKAGNKKA